MTTGDSRERPFLGWRMVAIAFLSYNCALGLTSGSFGVVLPVLERELNTSRAMASMGIGAMLLVVGLLAPVVGNLLRRIKVRTMMIAGTLINALGFLILAYAQDIWIVLATFGLLVGTGACLMGVIPAPVLISRWFIAGKGKALGMAMMPLFILIAPPIAAVLIGIGGRELLFLSLSGLFVALVPILMLVVEKPEDVGQKAPGAEPVTAGEAQPSAPLMSAGMIFSDARFWVLSMIIGILTAGGIAFVTHGAAMAMSKGMDLATASMLLSAYGGGTLVGAFAYGWLIDRIGAFTTLIINAAFVALVWVAFLGTDALSLMTLLSFIIGTCSGATVALHSSAMTEIVGTDNFSAAMGYSYLTKVPFLFGGGPIGGYLYDRSGDYVSTLILFAAAGGVAVLLALVLAQQQRRSLRLAGSAA